MSRKAKDWELELFNLVVKSGGYVTLDQKYVNDPTMLQLIVSIKAVQMTPELVSMYNNEEHDGNRFYDLASRLAESFRYYEFVHDGDNKDCYLVGFMVFRSHDGEEIKMKWFGMWRELYRLVLKKGYGRNGERVNP